MVWKPEEFHLLQKVHLTISFKVIQNIEYGKKTEH